MFLAVLGHDLRGPLSGIEMSAMLLAKPAFRRRRQQAAARIKRASRDMKRLITDLLEYTRPPGCPASRRPRGLRSWARVRGLARRHPCWQSRPAVCATGVG
ncbi:MAG: hypothetical protein IPM01_30540 [Burkholderiaceae bacterium]|nr:hypothetical protein [Burkholderiaceae bacterium]